MISLIIFLLIWALVGTAGLIITLRKTKQEQINQKSNLDQALDLVKVYAEGIENLKKQIKDLENEREKIKIPTVLEDILSDADSLNRDIEACR